MIEVIKSPTPVVEKTQWTAFLAGPMNGAPSWQAQAPKVAAKVGIENLTLLNPRKTDRFVSHPVLDSPAGQRDETASRLCHYHKVGDGRELSAWA